MYNEIIKMFTSFIFNENNNLRVITESEETEDSNEISKPLLYVSAVLNCIKLFLYILLLVFHYKVNRTNPIRKKLSVEMVLAGLLNIVSYFVSYFNKTDQKYEKDPPILCQVQALVGMFSQYYFMFILCLHVYAAFAVLKENYSRNTRLQLILDIAGPLISLVAAMLSSGILHFTDEAVGVDQIKYCRLNRYSHPYQNVVCFFFFFCVVFAYFYYYCKLRSHLKKFGTEKKKDKSRKKKIEVVFKQLKIYGISTLIATLIFLCGTLEIISGIFGYDEHKHVRKIFTIFDLVTYIIEVIAYPFLTFIFSGITWQDAKQILLCRKLKENVYDNLNLEDSINKTIEEISDGLNLDL